MSTDYCQTIDVPVSAETAFHAVTLSMSEWWTTMSGPFAMDGDKATASWPDGTTWSFEVKSHRPAEHLELYCYQADHIHPSVTPEMRVEWEGTCLVFDFETMGKRQSRVTMAHRGLTPQLNCFDICVKGWDLYFGGSLKSYLDGKSTAA
ncbi:hypothetical protein [Roseibium algae]|uniref:Activator of Hsp90 ATPase-like protein n=1 Tax=Roseibium algae TaxID=3123038 RepID=A0ABU8TH16_9HYPH